MCYTIAVMKKLHRFLLDTLPEGSPFTITAPDVVHLIRTVLKLRIGEHCIVFTNGSDDVIVRIEDIEKHSITVHRTETTARIQIPKQITAYVAITKRDTFELLVQKLTELGVSRIVPIITERTIKLSLNHDRLQKISDEALEQSGGSLRAMIEGPLSLEKALARCDGLTCIYFDSAGTTMLPYREKKELGFFIGPEGGWSDDERTLFATHTVTAVSLCATTLRAETAGIVGAYTVLWM